MLPLILLATAPYAAAVIACSGLFIWHSCALRRKKGGRARHSCANEPPITIVVCVADADAHTCAKNMASLSSSLGSKDNVIVVADHVSEDSIAALKGVEAADRRFKVKENNGPQGKKNAQRMGVEAAKTEAIAAMDADCRVGDHLLDTIRDAISQCGNKSYMLLLPIEMRGEGGLMTDLVEIEFGCLQVVTAGTAMMGRPSMANGAGMAFNKTLFLSHDAKTEYASGDDMFLLEHAIKTGSEVKYVSDGTAIVTTDAPTTATAYLRQRTRWLAKAGGFRSPNVIVLALMVFVAVMSWPAALIFAASGVITWGGAAIAFCAKLAVDTTACGAWIWFAHGAQGLKRLWLALPLEIIYPVMTLTVTLRAIAASRSRW